MGATCREWEGRRQLYADRQWYKTSTNELNPNKNLLPTAYLFSKSIMASTIIASRRDDRTENHIGLTDNYKRRYHVI
ncbi:MAG: hypothetical protein WA220_09815 [Candidatus Nitrosopolaris sp.]